MFAKLPKMQKKFFLTEVGQQCCRVMLLSVYIIVKARIFLLVDLQNPLTVIFRNVEKKTSKIIFLFYPQTLNIIYLVEKNNVFLRFCLCIFKSDTVKSDCRVQIFRKMIKYIKI